MEHVCADAWISCSVDLKDEEPPPMFDELSAWPQVQRSECQSFAILNTQYYHLSNCSRTPSMSVCLRPSVQNHFPSDRWPCALLPANTKSQLCFRYVPNWSKTCYLHRKRTLLHHELDAGRVHMVKTPFNTMPCPFGWGCLHNFSLLLFG